MVRLNLVLSQRVKDQIEKVKEATDADSMSEVIRRALAVYDLLCEESAHGAVPVVKYKDGRERELILLP